MELIKRISTPFEVNSLSFNPNSSSIAASGFASLGVHLFDLHNGEPKGTASHPVGPAISNSIHWMTSELLVDVYGGGGNKIGIWNIRELENPRIIDAALCGGVANITFSKTNAISCAISMNSFHKGRANIWLIDLLGNDFSGRVSELVPCNSIWIDQVVYIAGNFRNSNGATGIVAMRSDAEGAISSCVVDSAYLGYVKLFRSPSERHIYLFGVDKSKEDMEAGKVYKIEVSANGMSVVASYSVNRGSKLLGVLNDGGLIFYSGTFDDYQIRHIDLATEEATAIVGNESKFTYGFSISDDGEHLAFGMENEILIFSV